MILNFAKENSFKVGSDPVPGGREEWRRALGGTRGLFGSGSRGQDWVYDPRAFSCRSVACVCEAPGMWQERVLNEEAQKGTSVWGNPGGRGGWGWGAEEHVLGRSSLAVFDACVMALSSWPGVLCGVCV